MGSSLTPNSSSAKRARSVKKGIKRRRKPAPSKLRTTPKGPDISPPQVVREIDDGLAATELRALRRRLELICSCAIVVEHALLEQNALLDDDAARVLKRHVGDELASLIAGIDSLLEGAKP